MQNTEFEYQGTESQKYNERRLSSLQIPAVLVHFIIEMFLYLLFFS